MGGAVKSLGNFAGLGSGPSVDVASNNAALQALSQNAAGQSGNAGNRQGQGLANYGQGNMSLNDLLENSRQDIDNGQGSMTDLINQAATNPLSGTRFATDQVQGNSLLQGGLDAIKGQLGTGQGLESKQTDILNNLQSQGFNLTPNDQSLYGQAAGGIARQFGQQGNQAASDLASRGLASAPSGAAGALFSGLAGNQNEMLAKAQQDIMQQRFSNTQNQIQQQQSFINSLNNQNNSAAGNYAAQGANDIQQQYGRQLAGVGQYQQGLQGAAGAQTGANAANNSANLGAANFAQANTPKNFMDFATAGAGQRIQSELAGSGGGGGGGSQMGPGGTDPTQALNNGTYSKLSLSGAGLGGG